MYREPDSTPLSERIYKRVPRPWWQWWMFWRPRVTYHRDYAAEARNRAELRARSGARLAALRAGPLSPYGPPQKNPPKDESVRRRLVPEPPEPSPVGVPVFTPTDLANLGDDYPRYAPKEDPPAAPPFRPGGAEAAFSGGGASGDWESEKVSRAAPSPSPLEDRLPQASQRWEIPTTPEVMRPGDGGSNFEATRYEAPPPPPAPEPPPPPPPPAPSYDSSSSSSSDSGSSSSSSSSD